MIWQDIALLAAGYAVSLYCAFRYGYEAGASDERFNQSQKEIEEMGRYVVIHGIKVPIPDPPPEKETIDK